MNMRPKDELQPAPMGGDRVLSEPARPHLDRSTAASLWPRTVALLTMGTLALTVLFWNTVGTLVGTWSNSSLYGHGLLIAPISAYLIWTRRSVLAGQAPTGSAWGAALMALAVQGLFELLDRLVIPKGLQ